MLPWEMVLAHRYEEAAACYETQLKKDPNDVGSLAGYATVLLCGQRYQEALSLFQRANDLVDPRLKGESQPYSAEIGTILWLLGKREESIRTFRTAVDGILNGTIGFADNAGGVSQGLLLWYVGVTAESEETVIHALKYLRKLSKKKRIQYWPGPVALLALGEKTFDDVVMAASGSNNLEGATVNAANDLLIRRQLVVALFYSATKQRSEGLEDACKLKMAACSRLKNPILEYEWYLACAEAKDILLRP